MEYFWCTSDTIPGGMGFDHFGSLHLAWLAVCAAAVLAGSVIYRRLGAHQRSVFRKAVALLLIGDELFKLIPMLIQGIFRVSYLPFHLCSINLFVIAWHAWRPGKLLDNFLYAICIPGALAALLFPSWTELPGWNYMCIHSFTVHILLVLYPAVQAVDGDIRPELKEVPKCLALLLAMAALALVLNLLWGTNFMFLMRASKGNPLRWFQDNWGSHLLGFPVIIAAVIALLYGPLELYHKIRKTRRSS